MGESVRFLSLPLLEPGVLQDCLCNVDSVNNVNIFNIVNIVNIVNIGNIVNIVITAFKIQDFSRSWNFLRIKNFWDPRVLLNSVNIVKIVKIDRNVQIVKSVINYLQIAKIAPRASIVYHCWYFCLNSSIKGWKCEAI